MLSTSRYDLVIDNNDETGYLFAMPRVARPYHHGDLRNAFIREAAKLVESDGVHALTLRELSRRLGVSHAAPTNHFADKSALLAELAAQGFDELAQEISRAPSGRSPEVRLRELGRAYVRFARRRPGHFRVMFGSELPEPAPKHLAETRARSLSTFRETVVAAMPEGRARSPQRIREAMFLAWAVVHGAATLVLDGRLAPQLVSSLEETEALEKMIEHAVTVVAAQIHAA
jgi:AcrR family transcriptional regulator